MLFILRTRRSGGKKLLPLLWHFVVGECWQFCPRLLKPMVFYWNVPGNLQPSLMLSEKSLCFGSIWVSCQGSTMLWSARCEENPCSLSATKLPALLLPTCCNSTSTAWKLGIKCGNADGVLCCQQLCRADLFRHVRLKLTQETAVGNWCWCCARPRGPDRFRDLFCSAWREAGVRKGCCDKDFPEQINQTSEEWQKTERKLHLHWLLQSDTSTLCWCRPLGAS